MIFWALMALLAAATVVVYVAGTITRSKIEDKLKENGIKDAMIDTINSCDNVISVKDLDSDKTLEIHGDDISYELNEGDRIYV